MNLHSRRDQASAHHREARADPRGRPSVCLRGRTGRPPRCEVKQAVEQLFKVTCWRSVPPSPAARTSGWAGRRASGPNWKKAIVTLKEGETIDLFEGQ